MISNLIVDDGDFSELLETEGREPKFPFLNNTPADRHARFHNRYFEGCRSGYRPIIQDLTSVTNLLTYSEDFTNAAWSKNSSTAAANVRANPNDGLVTMGRLLEVAATAEHSLSRAYTFGAAVQHTLMVCAAPGLGRNWLRLKATDGTTNFTCFFDLANGRVGTAANCTGEIIPFDDGSFLCSIAFTPLAAVGSVTYNVASDGATVSYAGDAAKGLYFYGAMLRVGARHAYISTTDATRTGLVPPIDDEDPFAFLVQEADEPTAIGGDLIRVPRVYARIPRPQIVRPGSRYVSKPDYTPTTTNPYDPTGGTDSGQVNIFSPFSTSGRAYRSDTGIYTSGDGRLYNNVLAITATLVGYATAGTFTLTYKSSTTGALAFNASSATIEAAINALADVIADGLLFHAITYLNQNNVGQIVLSIYNGGTTTTAITMDPSGLTVNTTVQSVTQVVSNVQQNICLPTHLTIATHGYNTSFALAVLWTGGAETYIYAPGQWGSGGANTVWIPNRGSNVVTGAYAGTYDTAYTPPSPDPGATYSAGWRKPSVRNLQYFYLPGVTAGIDSPDDIVAPVGMQDPAVFLTALLAGTTGYQTYESDGPAVWMGTMYVLTVTQYNFTQLV